jgi:biopolymer transport protein ExbD
MNFRRGQAREEPEINLIPMIDVLLVILIFLMVTTTYAKYAQLQINLPQAQGERNTLAPATLDIGVDALGHYVVNHRSVPFTRVEEFSKELQTAAAALPVPAAGTAPGTPDPVVVITTDANATHQSVVNVMEAARLAGLTHITFTTQSER